MTWAAGIDLGGTRVKAVAVTTAGAILAQSSRATRDGEAGVDEWVATVQASLADFTRQLGSEPTAVGVAAPGLAAKDGRCIAYLPGKLAGLERLDWTRSLARSAVVPVLNDAHAALVGEAWVGAAQGRQNVVMVTLGTGVGGAVICDGRLLRGAIGRAGHLGHLCLDPEGPASITGMPGAVEMLVGDGTVAARSGGRFSSTEALVRAAEDGDAAARQVWQSSMRALGCAIGSYVNLFDPEIVVVGGGIARAGDALFQPLREEVARVEWRPGGHAVPVVPAQLGDLAGAMGAARNALTLS